MEVGVNARAAGGLLLETGLTFSNNTYQKYQVDSVHYNKALAGHIADYAGNKIVGIPDVFGSVTLGLSPAAWNGFAKIIAPIIGMGEGELMVCGMSLGHADESAKVNTFHTPRVAAEDFTRWVG